MSDTLFTSTNDLKKFFEGNHDGRRIHKWMHYFEIYDKHFSRFRNQEVHILEIGVNQGGSLRMWKEYFGKNAKIYGVDIDHRCKDFEEENIQIFIGSQEDKTFLRELRAAIPRIDILLDDGGHSMTQQKTTFDELFPYVDENGVYLCEDVHTSYWKGYGGGFKRPDNFVEYTKNWIDQLNAWHSKEPETFKTSSFTLSAHSMHYYDSIVVVEKKKMRRPHGGFSGETVFHFPKPEIAEQKIQQYLGILEKAPQNYLVQKQLGDAFNSQKNYAQAIHHYNQALTLDREPGIYFSLGNAKKSMGNLEGAIADYRTSLGLLLQKPFGVYLTSVCKNLRETILKYRREELTNYASEYRTSGDLQFAQGQYKAAIHNYRIATYLNPRLNIYAKLSQSLEQEGQIEEAIEACQKAIALKPKDILFFRIAKLYLKANNSDKAIENFEHAIDMNPGLVSAMSQLAVLCERKKDFEQSTLYLRKILSLQPENHVIWTRLGNNLKSQGDVKEAEFAFSRGLVMSR